MNTETSHQWKIIRKTAETPTVTSLYLTPTADRPTFIAGQYLTIQIPDIGPAEGKAYSISSAPHEEYVRVSIKKMGVFSSAILAHNIGDTITTSAPYGFFYPEPTDINELALVVGGIGIAPVLSIIKQLAHTKDLRSVHLFYSNKTLPEIAFKTELDTIAESYPQLKLHHHLTQETPIDPTATFGRITPEHIITQLADPGSAEIFLCGTMDFTKSLWRSLRTANIAQHQIYTEGFF